MEIMQKTANQCLSKAEKQRVIKTDKGRGLHKVEKEK